MFKFLFGRFKPSFFRVLYTYEPGTYVLEQIVAARNEYEANRLFDQMYADDARVRRLGSATTKIET